MRNFQDTFESRKLSYISAFSVCITVPSTAPEQLKKPFLNEFSRKIFEG